MSRGHVRPADIATRLAVGLKAIRNKPPPGTELALSLLGFRLAWISLFAFHSLCAISYGVWAYVHCSLTTSAQVESLSFIGLILDPVAFTVAGGVFTAFAVLHIWEATRMATVSLRQSRLIMIPPSREICATQNRLTRLLHRLWDILTRTVVALKHHYYDELFTAQEVLEIVLLSQRGYGFTQWQSHSWPLRCYVVFLVASCWCTPFFHWKLHSTKATQHLVSKVADMLCDFATTLVLPAAMSWPQLPLFDAHFVWYHGDTSGSGAGADLQQKALQGMPQTTFDVLNVVVFSVFLMTRVVGVRASIRLQSTTGHSQKQAMWVVVNKPRRQGQRLWMRAIHTLAFVWGLVVVIATIISETRSRYIWCENQAFPWFVMKAQCTVVQFNCSTLSIGGAESELDLLLSNVNHILVREISFSDCPTLEVPPTLQRLSELRRLRFADCNLVRWNASVAILDRFQPFLDEIGLVNVSLPSGFPQGLCCTGQFPEFLNVLKLDSMNLSSIPESLDSVWRRPRELSLNGNAFSSVPGVVRRLQPVTLSMENNNLIEVPPDLFVGSGSFWGEELRVSQNPIKNLPNDLPPHEKLRSLWLDHTEIFFLPAWVVQTTRLALTRTPFCTSFANLTVGERALALTASNMSYMVQPWVSGLVDCVHGAYM